jgi:hypothetical protein
MRGCMLNSVKLRNRKQPVTAEFRIIVILGGAFMAEKSAGVLLNPIWGFWLCCFLLWVVVIGEQINLDVYL